MLETKNDGGEALSARALVERIAAQYRTLGVASQALGRRKRGPALFEKWFHGVAPTNMPPLYEDFLATSQALSNELAAVLRETEDPTVRSACAWEAVQVILAPKPLGQKTQDEWYLVAAEYSAHVLLAFLARSDLMRLRDDYVRNTPKRMMYPRQRDLFRLMQDRLSISRDNAKTRGRDT